MIDSVPWLRSGTGKTPADGGCIMQVIDWIDRHEWSDKPPCVHPVLRELAIGANDRLDNGQRQKLLDLAPRLINTSNCDINITKNLAIFCARYVLHIYEDRYPNDNRPRRAIEAAELAILSPTPENMNAAAAYANAANAVKAVYAAAAAANAARYAARSAAYAARSAAYAADAARSANAVKAAYQLLIDVLAEYERLAGRNQVENIDYSCVVEAMNAREVMSGA